MNLYRALDLTDQKGWLCGALLADLGIDVIKVEKPGGDTDRHLAPFYHDQPDPEKSIPWWAYNAGKRSITLDLATGHGQKTFLRLAEVCDFVIESFTPGYMSELGLGYNSLSRVNPGLIMVSITGFGQNGPYAGYKASDIVCMAISGYMNLSGEPDRPPLRISIPQAFLHAANDAAVGALMALWHREKTGQGQWVDVSAQECMAWLTFTNHVYWDFSKLIATRASAGNASLTPGEDALSVIYDCKDGQLLFRPVAGRNGHRIRKFVEWMSAQGWHSAILNEYNWEGNPLATPDRTGQPGETNPESSPPSPAEVKERLWEKSLEIRQEFIPFLLSRSRNELFQEAVANGFLLAPLNSVDEVFHDPHLQTREFWRTVDYSETAAVVIYPGVPHFTTSARYGVTRRAPLIGEHNAEILDTKSAFWNRRKSNPANEPVNSAELFEDLKIIDFSWVIVGPRTTRYFADHGATVIKVEAPQRPDIGRAVPPFKDEIMDNDHSGLFGLYNVNKFAITIDLSKPQGLELAKRLVKWADVLVESFRPAVMQRLGLGYETVRALNPRLIYASTCIFGQTGPYRNFAGYGHLAAAFAGFDDLVGWPDRSPSGAFWAYTDHIAPQFLVRALITALLERERTGRGQHIDQSQVESALFFLSPAFLDYEINGRVATRNGNRDPHAAPHGAYRCTGEDRWCVIAVENDQDWVAFCNTIGQPGLIQHKRFASLQARKQNEDELDRIVEAWTCRLTAETVMSRLQAAGVAAGIVANAQDMHYDPQLQHRKYFLTFDHPVIGPHDVDALPPRFSKTPAGQYKPEPCLGEHNAYVCTEILKMPDSEFVDMLQAGVFG